MQSHGTVGRREVLEASGCWWMVTDKSDSRRSEGEISGRGCNSLHFKKAHARSCGCGGLPMSTRSRHARGDTGQDGGVSISHLVSERHILQLLYVLLVELLDICIPSPLSHPLAAGTASASASSSVHASRSAAGRPFGPTRPVADSRRRAAPRRASA